MATSDTPCGKATINTIPTGSSTGHIRITNPHTGNVYVNPHTSIDPTSYYPTLNYHSLKAVHDALGDDFEIVAPQMYAIFREMENIHKYRKASELLGGG